MTLAELSIRRPVLTIVIALFILLMGSISLTKLPVREYPAIDPPTVSITTSYPGAAAEVVQTQITERIEEAVNTVAGIDTLSSVSREGASVITAEFKLGVDLDVAASDIRDQFSRAARFLPADINPPILNKADADSNPIFGIALSSQTKSQLELGAFADSLRERLQTVPGIASVDQPAEKRYAMRLWMDPGKLSAYGVSPLDVKQVLAKENIELPAGRIEGSSVEFPVKTMSRLTTVEQFNNLIVKRSADRIVRFKELGERPSIGLLSYTSAKNYGMKAVQGAVVGLMEEKKVDALVYPTRPAQPEMIDPETPNIVERPRRPSLSSIANVTQFPDVIVPAGVTKEKMPVTISFFGPAYSEPRLLGYAYAYEQATHRRISPATTPALPGEKFDY